MMPMPKQLSLVLAAVAMLFVSPPRPVFAEVSVPGFAVMTYAVVTDPGTLSFDATGNLYVGRDNSGTVAGGFGDAVRIHRVGAGGTPVVELGATAIPDPDAVVYDAAGVVSGTPGSVLVGGVAPGSGAKISVIRPDGSVATRFGPTFEFRNPGAMVFDRTGRLLFTDVGQESGGTSQVMVTSGASPTRLFSLPSDPLYITVDEGDRIFTSARDGRIRIHEAGGALVNGAFASGLGDGSPIAFGRGGTFGTDLYALDSATGDLLRFDAAGGRTVVGRGFGLQTALAFGADGSLYVAMFDEDRIVRIFRDHFALELACPVTAVRGGTFSATLTATNGAAQSRTLGRAAVLVHSGGSRVIGPRSVRLDRTVPVGAVVHEPVAIPVPVQARAGSVLSVGLSVLGQRGLEPKRTSLGRLGCLVEIE